VNNYEGLFIIKPDLAEADAGNLVKAIGDTLTKNKASVKKEENWGKRQLTYPIKKFREGMYYKVEFQSSPEAVSKLREAYALTPEILRIMITKR